MKKNTQKGFDRQPSVFVGINCVTLLIIGNIHLILQFRKGDVVNTSRDQEVNTNTESGIKSVTGWSRVSDWPVVSVCAWLVVGLKKFQFSAIAVFWMHFLIPTVMSHHGRSKIRYHRT